MPFKLIPSPTFTANVALSVPGEAAAVLVNFTFRHLSREAFQAWQDRLVAEPTKPFDVFREIVVDWSGVEGPDGKPVPFSEEALATLLAGYPAADVEIFRAYRRELVESRVKN